MVALSEFAEELEIEAAGGYLGDAGIGRGAHVCGAATGFERRSFTDDTARPDMADDSSVDSHLEDAVEHECYQRRLLVLTKQEVAGA